MCNACGNYCCGSDMFGKCGCDGCPEQDCWADDEDEDYNDDFDCCARPMGFACQDVTGSTGGRNG